MMRTVAHLLPFAALAGGILILVKPPLLNYVVAVYLILVGTIGINHMYHFIRWERLKRAAGCGRQKLFDVFFIRHRSIPKQTAMQWFIEA
jgi:hypothetical protein